MSEQNVDIEAPVQGLNDPPGEGALIERLRQHREEVAENKTFDIDIPGYKGELFCRYKLLGNDEVVKIARDARRQFKGNQADAAYANACDSIIKACEEFFARDEGREIPLREHPDVQSALPVRYDQKLADILGLEITVDQNVGPARQVLLALFGDNSMAITAHSAILLRWMMKTGLEVDLELGEI